jgi:hypothetical protein
MAANFSEAGLSNFGGKMKFWRDFQILAGKSNFGGKPNFSGKMKFMKMKSSLVNFWG